MDKLPAQRPDQSGEGALRALIESDTGVQLLVCPGDCQLLLEHVHVLQGATEIVVDVRTQEVELVRFASTLLVNDTPF